MPGVTLVRSKAPLRLGLAGGGTDVAPYSDIYGGAVLNATINLYARATLRPRTDGLILIRAADLGLEVSLDPRQPLDADGPLKLAHGVYNHVVREFDLPPLSFELTTSIDAPGGSGLGSSSTLAVAVLGAFAEWLTLPLGAYDIARRAYRIEREELGLHGGKQDQYAATFGGFNFMEFLADDRVIVNPLRIEDRHVHELAHNLVLYSTGTSRVSSEIIARQSQNVRDKRAESIDAMHRIKEEASAMKEALVGGSIDRIGERLHQGWEHKKRMADGITNESLDDIYRLARSAGATGGKVTGAGGGGYMMFYAPGTARYEVVKALAPLGGSVTAFEFEPKGLSTWSI